MIGRVKSNGPGRLTTLPIPWNSRYCRQLSLCFWRCTKYFYLFPRRLAILRVIIYVASRGSRMELLRGYTRERFGAKRISTGAFFKMSSMHMFHLLNPVVIFFCKLRCSKYPLSSLPSTPRSLGYVRRRHRSLRKCEYPCDKSAPNSISYDILHWELRECKRVNFSRKIP